MKGIALAFLMFSFICTCQGMFMFHETEQVPIARLFTNLEARVAKNKDDVEATYHLARLHSMAYATNTATFPVTKKDQQPYFEHPAVDSGVPEGVAPKFTPTARRDTRQHLTNAIALYERSIVLLKKTNNGLYQNWYILPIHLGYAWCLEQAGRTNDAVTAYRKTLDIAWRKEVTGDFSIKQWVSERWNDVQSGRSPLHASKRRGYLGPGIVFSSETIHYLLRLLDPVKDKSEIADLKAREQQLSKMGRAITPILVPLLPNLDIADCIDGNSPVAFDLDGSGLKRRWGWVTPQAAWLVFDQSGKGQITSALQMFGNVTFWIFWSDGYQALAALDTDSDGVLKGDELDGLALWQDRNSNGVSEPGEVRPVSAYGIQSISCKGEVSSTGAVWNPAGVVFSNGTSRATYDWVVHTEPDGKRDAGKK
ncbi:MAG: hypothetical protein JWM16_2589 [Verrucomicrobiales bacterium]|nr:hypothetical protein [Verrucomicrobiales bacterium]